LYSYRLHWGSKMPLLPNQATVVATRTGVGGVVGQKRKYYSKRFVVDFAGGDLQLMGPNAKVSPVISVSSGEVEVTSARPLVAVQGYRVTFDLKPTAANVAPIDLRVFLTVDGQPLSETWLYQWTPPAVADRGF
jgi:glucans biosynthesis protein